MADHNDDSHLAPARPDEDVDVVAPLGFRHLAKFVGGFGRFVRLAERQGTRLVDVLDRWADIAEEHNRITERGVAATERLTEVLGGSGYTNADAANGGKPEEPDDNA